MSSQRANEIESELRILNFLESIRALSGSQIPFLTAEDVFSLIQEVALIGATFFDLEEWRSHRLVNPDVIVGETDTSSDKTVAGTVSSRKVFRHKPISHGQSPELVGYFHSLYTEAKGLKEVVRMQNFFLHSNQLSSRGIPITRESKRTVEPQTRTDTISQTRLDNQIGYSRRKTLDRAKRFTPRNRNVKEVKQ